MKTYFLITVPLLHQLYNTVWLYHRGNIQLARSSCPTTTDNLEIKRKRSPSIRKTVQYETVICQQAKNIPSVITAFFQGIRLQDQGIAVASSLFCIIFQISPFCFPFCHFVMKFSVPLHNISTEYFCQKSKYCWHKAKYIVKNNGKKLQAIGIPYTGSGMCSDCGFLQSF